MFRRQNRKFMFFGQVHFGDEYIIASYLGDEGVKLDENKRPKAVQKTKLLMFDLEGNLSKVIETEQGIRYFAVDDENKRILCYFTDKEVPLGYFYYQ